MKKRGKSRIVYSHGINDSAYDVTSRVVGAKITCPYYVRWREILRRCYSQKFHEKQPTYVGCTLDTRWHLFSNFRAWMETQDWEGNYIDKDLLVEGNKHYGPDTCVFVSRDVNNFLTDSRAARGEFPVGVCWHKGVGKYAVRCGSKNVGYFLTIESASCAYWEAKLLQASLLADQQKDQRVADAIRRRYCV